MGVPLKKNIQGHCPYEQIVASRLIKSLMKRGFEPAVMKVRKALFTVYFVLGAYKGISLK